MQWELFNLEEAACAAGRTGIVELLISFSERDWQDRVL